MDFFFNAVLDDLRVHRRFLYVLAAPFGVGLLLGKACPFGADLFTQRLITLQVEIAGAVHVGAGRLGVNAHRVIGPQHQVGVLPTLILPTRSSTRSIFAGLRVTNFQASSSLTPP